MSRAFRFSVCLCLAAAPAASQELPQLALDPNATTISGLSSGAFMTVQMHVAFSNVIRGVGVVAGGPYYCAQEQLLEAISTCMAGNAGLPDPAASLAAAERFAALGLTDPVSGLSGDRVYLFSGTEDETVVQPVMDQTEAFYRLTGPSEVAYRRDVPAGHAFLAEGAPISCSETEEPFINDCQIDLAGDILRFLYEHLDDPVPTVPENLKAFSQSAYLSNPEAHSMADEGFVYIPTACAAGADCKLHIAFHGCKQGIDRLGDQYATTTGYNEWAEANDIVVLYPQAISRVFDGNPNGCWDWWGYDDPDYATKNGPQMAAVAQMATALGVAMIGPGSDTPLCVSHESFNSLHWQEDRAELCGFGQFCAVGSGDPIGIWVGATTLYETAPGQFQVEDCSR